jgi:hypothetical protein
MSEANAQQFTAAPVASKLPHFTISFEFDGFPVVAEAECKADTLPAIIERLKALGATPPTTAVSAPAPASAILSAAPVCPVHSTPMKASRKPGSFFCPRQMDDGSYCPSKA